MLHEADLPPLRVRHDELAPKLEKLAVDLIFDVSVFVPDVKMVERENPLLQIKRHCALPHCPAKICAIGESDEMTSVLLSPVSAFLAISSARMNS